MLEQIYEHLILLDVITVSAAIVWLNLVAIVVILVFWKYARFMNDASTAGEQIVICLLFMVVYTLFILRGAIPDIISSAIANVLFFLGVCAGYPAAAEADTYVYCGSEPGDDFFHVHDISHLSDHGLLFMTTSRRVVIASMAIAGLSLIYIIRCITSSKASSIVRSSSIPYILLVVTGGVRLVTGFMRPDITLHTMAAFQSFYYIALLLHSFFSVLFNFLFMKIASDQEIEQMATRDSLTDLLNRRSFMILASKLFMTCRDRKKMVAVLFIDIDSFKEINDTHGHDAGDAILVAYARILSEHLRIDELCCRYGGDEFCICMAMPSAEMGHAIANRILEAIRATDFPSVGKIASSIGLYYGVPGRRDSLESFIKGADEAMYSAKESGKNQVVALGNVKDSGDFANIAR